MNELLRKAAALLSVLALASSARSQATNRKPQATSLAAHYMPWFQSKPVSGAWGWHWTMNYADPDGIRADRPRLASHYHPLMGLYDSGDQQALDCHVLLMKFAGIDGVLVDWYGDIDHYDYASNDRNTERMFRTAKRAGLKFAVVYEDGTVAELIKAHKFEKPDAVNQGKRLIQSLQDRWFRSPNYLTVNGKPLFLVFGPRYYYDSADWKTMFSGLSPQPAFYTVHKLLPPADGAFDWPLPQGGTQGGSSARQGFYRRAKDWRSFVAAAYPRFHDFYHDANVQPSYGVIEDLDGKTYETTLTEALQSKAPIVQIATWNDWGEGTVIEPSVEFGYRDLETTQRLHRRFLGSLPYAPADLRLPIRLYLLQKKYASNADMQRKLSSVTSLLFSGRLVEARRILNRL